MNEAGGDDRTPGERIAGKYLLLRLLEIGGMGAVWVAHHLGLDIHVAIKFIRADASSAVADERLMQEARAAARVHHPAIVHVSDVGQTVCGDTYLVMELLDGEPLCDVLERERRLEPVTAVRVLLPIAAALSALHAKKILHRDVKPENIFLSCDDGGRWQPKLIDFGLARTPGGGARLTQRGYVVGTPDYMSPERMAGLDAIDQDDVWSLTAVLYETVTGVPVVDHPRIRGLPRSIVEHGVDDEELWDVLRRGLAHRGRRFASAQALGKALAVWLWKRGGVDDISGVALRPIWLGEDDVRQLSAPTASRVETARFAAPFRTRGTTPVAVEAAATARAASSSTTTLRAEPVIAARSRSRRAAALAALGVGLTATGALLWVHSSPAGDGAAPTALPAAPTASQLPTPGPAESATDPPAPSSSARPLPPVGSATPRAPRGAGRPAVDGLKNPVP